MNNLNVLFCLLSLWIYSFNCLLNTYFTPGTRVIAEDKTDTIPTFVDLLAREISKMINMLQIVVRTALGWWEGITGRGCFRDDVSEKELFRPRPEDGNVLTKLEEYQGYYIRERWERAWCVPEKAKMLISWGIRSEGKRWVGASRTWEVWVFSCFLPCLVCLGCCNKVADWVAYKQ